MRINIEEYIKESNAIEDITSQREIDQSLFAWRFLKKKKALSHLDIMKLHKLITLNQNNLGELKRGRYRSASKTNVFIGEIEAPDHSEVDKLMDDWLNQLPQMSPLLAHVRFEHIHPFVDGNGRVGRMLYWWQSIQLDMKPKLYTKKFRGRYYNLFDEKKIEYLKKNNWGINFNPTHEATIETTEGEKLRGEFFSEPTVEMLKASLPSGKEYSRTILIKKL